MKQYILSTAFCLITFVIYGQSFKDNQDKYWWYRYRLVNDFMKIGDQCGESIPAAYRHEPSEGADGYIPPPFSGRHLHFVDATLHLGQYMAVLATEYKLLKRNQQSVQRTLYEMYYAIKAFDRIDRNAEAYCRNFNGSTHCQQQNCCGSVSPESGDLNGFFIRDDVPKYFVNNNQNHFNRPGIACEPVNWELGSVVGNMDGYVQISDASSSHIWEDEYPETPHYPNEMSQDQVAQLYTGLALIIYLIEPGEMWAGENIKSMAQASLLRMSYRVALPAGQFIIRNPLTDKCVFGIHPEEYPGDGACMSGGAYIFPNAPAIGKGLFKINASWGAGADYAKASTILSWSNSHQPHYQFLKYVTTCSNEMIFPNTYTAIGKEWRMVGLFGLNVSREVIKRQSLMCDFRWPHLPLIYRIFHGGAIMRPESQPPWQDYDSYEIILNKMPKCRIYFHHETGAYENWEWSSLNRLAEPQKRGTSTGPTGLRGADVNALDYMLLFNLYLMNDDGYADYYTNAYYAENLNLDIPLAIGLGSAAIPLVSNTLEYLSLATHIFPTGRATFRNAKKIVLLPGFKADQGCKFRAYIEDYTCCGGQRNENSEFSGTYTTAPPFVPYIVPTDSIPDYVPTPSEWSADSAASYSTLMSSGDSLAIEYILELMSGTGIGTIGAKINLPPTNQQSQFKIYPNPTDGQLNIIVGDNDIIKQVSVYDALGKVILYSNYRESQVKINMRQFVRGKYIIRVQTEKSVFIEKVSVAY